MNKQNIKNGYILIVTTVLMAVLLTYSAGLVNLAAMARGMEKKEDFKLVSNAIAEAGLQKALWCLNQSSGTDCGGTYGGNYSGETNLSFGGGILDIGVSTISGNVKQIEASAYYPSKSKIYAKTIMRIKASINADMASFIYGMQVGQGGVEMGNGAIINGSVYSHGDIEGGSGSRITGDAYVAGGTALAADQIWTVYDSDYIFGKTNPQIDIAQSFIPSSSNVINKISVYIKKAGAPGNITVKIVEDDNGAPGDTSIAQATLYSSLVSTDYSWIDVSFSNPPPVWSGVRYWLVLDASQNGTKYWKIGADAFDGYSGGTMLYAQSWSSGSWTGTGKDINFKIWFGGVVSKIDNMIINGNAYAHRILDSTVGGNASAYTLQSSIVGKNAWANDIDSSTIGWHATTTNITSSTVGYNLWCQNYFSTTVGWNRYCPTAVTPPADPGPVNLPISDALIADWKTDAEAGGVIEGDYTVDGIVNLGPKKINGNLAITIGSTLNLTGAIYVTGTITTGNEDTAIRLDPSYGAASGMIISDGPINLGNENILSGTGDGSYLVLISTFRSATDEAINVGNTVNAAIFYAPYGIIKLGNNATFEEVVAYELDIGTGSILNYESGLANISFSSGPAGGWSEVKGSWVMIE